MDKKKFDSKRLQILNDPQRLKDIPVDYVWDRLDIAKADILVEIGAGTAFFSIAFFQYARPSKVYACDVSEVMINWIEENVVPRYPNIVPVKTEGDSIPLDDEIADLVFMIDLHHELDNPGLILEESYRILRPNGGIFIVDWKKEDMAEGPPKEIRYLPEQVKRQMMDSGFRHIDIFDELPRHFLVVGER